MTPLQPQDPKAAKRGLRILFAMGVGLIVAFALFISTSEEETVTTKESQEPVTEESDVPATEPVAEAIEDTDLDAAYLSFKEDDFIPLLNEGDEYLIDGFKQTAKDFGSQSITREQAMQRMEEVSNQFSDLADKYAALELGSAFPNKDQAAVDRASDLLVEASLLRMEAARSFIEMLETMDNGEAPEPYFEKITVQSDQADDKTMKSFVLIEKLDTKYHYGE